MMRRRGPGLARGIARTAVVAGTASVVAGQVHHHQQQKWDKQATAEQQAAYDQQVAYEQQMQAQQAAAEPDYAAELEKLSQLKNQGILTEEEFQAKKKQILGI